MTHIQEEEDGAQAWITQFHLQITPLPQPLPRKRSPDGASSD